MPDIRFDSVDGPHFLSQVRCLTCLHNWTSVYPEDASELQLECPRCGSHTSTVITRIAPGGGETGIGQSENN